ncbi:hypothetical protein [Streptomyces alkaliphilus]|uniref:hypothetical protein n=1 Tax=Streptomyces alkaliphilus TaxID=1472722 RepID=UPI00117E646B|nr:hypothetical protein [Streptomyces alkaliphilus]MQS07864.1 hypothetical protein [Streptomyces alkaliphilus]
MSTSAPPPPNGGGGGRPAPSGWSRTLAFAIGALVAGFGASVFTALGIVTAVEAGETIERMWEAGHERAIAAARGSFETLRGRALVGLLLAVIGAVLVWITRHRIRAAERARGRVVRHRSAAFCAGLAKGLCSLAVTVSALLLTAALIAPYVSANG